MRKQLLILLLLAFFVKPIIAQQIESGYIASSDLKDNAGNKAGKSAIQYISGSFSIPLSIERVEQIKNIHSSTKQNGKIEVRETKDTVMAVKMWQLTFTGKYTTLDNDGILMQHHPDDIINAGVMITHICPIAHRWSLISTTGVTLNAPSSYIRRQSIAITAGLIFQYKVNNNLSMGVGAVATTSYGEPVILPAPIINWKSNGKYSIELNMHGKPQLTIATKLNEKTKLVLTPFDTEHFSALTNIDGDHKVFIRNIVKSTLAASYRFTKHWSLESEIGYIYYHGTRIQERSSKAFWKDIFSNDNRMRYSNNATFSLGLRYHFR